MQRAILWRCAAAGWIMLVAGCGDAGSNVAFQESSGDTAGTPAGDESLYTDGAAAPIAGESSAAAFDAAPATGVTSDSFHRTPTAGPSPVAASATPASSPTGGAIAPATPPPIDAAGESRTRETSPEPPREADDVARPREGREPARQQIQSGLLTAGSFDDNQRLADYQKYVSKVLQHDSAESFPRFAVGERVVIQVADEQGRPVGGAKVVVRSAGQESRELVSSITGSDGRVIFCTALDKAAGDKVFEVSVTPAGSAQAVTETRKLDEHEWRITLKGQEAQLPGQLDLALVIDTTGSMGDELEYLKVEIDSIVASVSRMFPDVDQRYALIVYRDQGDEYVTRTFDFTGSLKEFQANLSAQFAGGGGDYPEAVHVAVEHADKLSWREGNTARVMFLVADAPPHDEYLALTLDGAQTLRRRGVRIYPLGGSGVGQMAQFIFRGMAFATLGQYLFLTDHSGVGNPHAKPDVPEFQVERLDRLMIRMISSELAGKRLAPQEVIAIERGELETDQPPLLEPQEGQQQPGARDTGADGAAAPQTEEEQASAAHSGCSSWLPSLAGSWLPWAGLALIVAGVFAADAVRDRRS
jgi:hypothetical protein